MEPTSNHIKDADPQLEIEFPNGRTQIYVLREGDRLTIREAPDDPKKIRGAKRRYGPCILVVEYRAGGHHMTEYPPRDEEVADGAGEGFWEFIGRLITDPRVEGEVIFDHGDNG